MLSGDEHEPPKQIAELVEQKRWRLNDSKGASPSAGQRGRNEPDVMYARVYFGLGRHFGLNPSESNLLALVHSLSSEGKRWCFMGQEGVAAALNVTIQTVNAHLEKLGPDGLELLERGERHPRWKTVQWRLSPKALDRLRYIQEQIARRKRLKNP